MEGWSISTCSRQQTAKGREPLFHSEQERQVFYIEQKQFRIFFCETQVAADLWDELPYKSDGSKIISWDADISTLEIFLLAPSKIRVQNFFFSHLRWEFEGGNPAWLAGQNARGKMYPLFEWNSYKFIAFEDWIF